MNFVYADDLQNISVLLMEDEAAMAIDVTAVDTPYDRKGVRQAQKRCGFRYPAAVNPTYAL